jgi:hypothetical protein
MKPSLPALSMKLCIGVVDICHKAHLASRSFDPMSLHCRALYTVSIVLSINALQNSSRRCLLVTMIQKTHLISQFKYVDWKDHLLSFQISLRKS